MLTHSGIKRAKSRLFRDMETKTIHVPLVMLTLFKVCAIVFLATVSYWTTDPTLITIIGFVTVVAIVFTRVVGWGFVNHGESIEKFVSDTANRISQRAKVISDTASKITEGAKDIRRKVSFVPGEHSECTSKTTKKAEPDTSNDASDNGSTSSKGGDSVHPREEIYDEMFDSVVVCDLSMHIVSMSYCRSWIVV